MARPNPNRFDLAARHQIRAGCGYGIHQAHLVGRFSWIPGNLEALAPLQQGLRPLLDDQILSIPDPADCRAVAEWFIRTLGSVLRVTRVASTRDMYLGAVQAGADGREQCAVALPWASTASTMTIQWLLMAMNSPPRRPEDVEGLLGPLLDEVGKKVSRSANSWRTLQAAYDDRFPTSVLGPSSVCIGAGERRRWFSSFVTDRTPHLAMQVAQDKAATAKLLKAHGFPGAIHHMVHSREEAVSAARNLGYPVVVKPNDRDRGQGVSAGIASEDDLSKAYATARGVSGQVLVEKFQPGFTHRITVVEGLILRVAKHVAFGVTGDGLASVDELVLAKANTPEERMRARRAPAAACRLDDEAMGLLRQYGLEPFYVPAAGEYVRLRRRDNISAGGQRITLDIGTEVHPDNAMLALDVCSLLRIDFAGIDFITPDIAQSWRNTPGTICEINGNPQLVARDDPAMYKKVLAHVVPGRGIVPVDVVVLAGPPGADQLSQLVGTFARSGSHAGLSTASGTWLNQRQVGQGFVNGHAAAIALATGTQAKRLTFVLTVSEVLTHGLPLGEIESLFLPWPSKAHIPDELRKPIRDLLEMTQPHIKRVKALRLDS
jgi:cyanophycin synthetase